MQMPLRKGIEHLEQVSHCMTKITFLTFVHYVFSPKKTISWIYKIIEKYLIGFLKTKLFCLNTNYGGDREGD